MPAPIDNIRDLTDPAHAAANPPVGSAPVVTGTGTYPTYAHLPVARTDVAQTFASNVGVSGAFSVLGDSRVSTLTADAIRTRTSTLDDGTGAATFGGLLNASGGVIGTTLNLSGGATVASLATSAGVTTSGGLASPSGVNLSLASGRDLYLSCGSGANIWIGGGRGTMLTAGVSAIYTPLYLNHLFASQPIVIGDSSTAATGYVVDLALPITCRSTLTAVGYIAPGSINTATTPGTKVGSIVYDTSGGANSGHAWVWTAASIWKQLDN